MHPAFPMNASAPYPGPERRARPTRSGLQHRLNPFFDLLRWIEAHVRGFHAAVGTVLLIGLGAILGAGLGLLGVRFLIGTGATQHFDREVLLWVNRRSSPLLDTLALELTILASSWGIATVAVLAGVLFWRTRHLYSAAALAVAVTGGFLLSTLLDAVLQRPQPGIFGWRISVAAPNAFTAGQVMLALAVYGTLAYLVVRLEATKGLRRLTLVAFAVLFLVIMGSRVYLGVQYPSDVLAGGAAGMAWAAVCALGFEAVRFFRSRSTRLPLLERDLDPPISRNMLAR